MAVLDRVVMDVFDVAGVIGFVLQAMLPIAVLPQRLLLLCPAGGTPTGSRPSALARTGSKSTNHDLNRAWAMASRVSSPM